MPLPLRASRVLTLRPDLAGKGFYCAVTEKFVTANLNKHNLNMECVTYA